MNFLKASIKKPLSFLSCGHFVTTEKWVHDTRTIDSFEIIIGVNGTAYIEQDGTKYEVKPGSVLLFFQDMSTADMLYLKKILLFSGFIFSVVESIVYLMKKRLMFRFPHLNQIHILTS